MDTSTSAPTATAGWLFVSIMFVFGLLGPGLGMPPMITAVTWVALFLSPLVVIAIVRYVDTRPSNKRSTDLIPSTTTRRPTSNRLVNRLTVSDD